MQGKFTLYISFVFLISGCSAENDTDLESDIVQSHAALSTTCTIVLGGGGKSQTITKSFTSQSDSYYVNTSSAWDFIRSTSGACTFTIYNDTIRSDRYVILGTDLSVRIRAGEDGIRYKDDGGGETWRVRAVKIDPVQSTDCFLNIGGGGVRMNYYPGNYAQTPAMDRISYFLGGNCDAKAWNDTLYGATDTLNRYVGLHTNATTATQANSRKVFDPGFRIRSLKIRNWGTSNCSTVTSLNRDFGRCLPSIMLSSSIYAITQENDKDADGLNDYQENILADAFTALVLNHSTENATRPYSMTDIKNQTSNSYPYYDYAGNAVIEPVVVFQIRKSSTDLLNRIEIVYMQIWKEDIYDTTFCSGHHGDTQSDVFVLETPPVGHNLHGKFWWLISTGGDVPTKSSVASQSKSEFNTIATSEIDIESLHIKHEQSRIDAQEKLEYEELSSLSTNLDLSNDDDLNVIYENDSLTAYEIDADKRNNNSDTISPLISDNSSTKDKEFHWKQGDTHVRGPLFERTDTDPSNTNRHVLYYYSKGKHHAFHDTKNSGESDYTCTLNTTYIDGRGNEHLPLYSKRLWNLRSPLNAGDAYNYNNVGSRNHFSGFVNRLDNFGFPYMKVWRDACFYSIETSSAAKSFNCSNNVNKLCCLETNPNCTLPDNGNQWCCHKAKNKDVSTLQIMNLCNTFSDVSNWNLYTDPDTIPQN